YEEAAAAAKAGLDDTDPEELSSELLEPYAEALVLAGNALAVYRTFIRPDVLFDYLAETLERRQEADELEKIAAGVAGTHPDPLHVPRYRATAQLLRGQAAEAAAMLEPLLAGAPPKDLWTIGDVYLDAMQRLDKPLEAYAAIPDCELAF